MGCDIHLLVEVREGGTWRLASHRRAASRQERDREGPLVAVEGLRVVPYPDTSPEYERSAFCPGRNYDLFAILADVRNGYGFAGCKTDKGFTPICDPRGIPEDASPEFLGYAEDWGADGHSHSWQTLAELQGYDWGRTTIRYGTLSLSEYAAWDKVGFPESFSGGVCGRDVVEVSTEQADEILKEHGALVRAHAAKHRMDCPTIDGKKYYVRASWKVTYRECARHFVEEIMPRLAKLGKPEDVRIVYFFDN